MFRFNKSSCFVIYQPQFQNLLLRSIRIRSRDYNSVSVGKYVNIIIYFVVFMRYVDYHQLAIINISDFNKIIISYRYFLSYL